MRIDIITCAPNLLKGALGHFIFQRAIDGGMLHVELHNLRDYAHTKYRKIDDEPYGGGAGMVLMIEPIDNCISALKRKHTYDEVIYMAPDGVLLTQGLVNDLSLKENLIILCGHYKGVDERVREHLVTMEISIGDYVLSGGEWPAIVLSDAIARLLPGALSDASSALTDSFQDGLVDAPLYTRPFSYKGMHVPDILVSGHHRAIQDWQQSKRVSRTKERRPNLLPQD